MRTAALVTVAALLVAASAAAQVAPAPDAQEAGRSWTMPIPRAALVFVSTTASGWRLTFDRDFCTAGPDRVESVFGSWLARGHTVVCVGRIHMAQPFVMPVRGGIAAWVRQHDGLMDFWLSAACQFDSERWEARCEP